MMLCKYNLLHWIFRMGAAPTVIRVVGTVAKAMGGAVERLVFWGLNFYAHYFPHAPDAMCVTSAGRGAARAWRGGGEGLGGRRSPCQAMGVWWKAASREEAATAPLSPRSPQRLLAGQTIGFNGRTLG